MDSQEKLFSMLFEKDDVTWQTLLYELIKKEEMDPWDINISLLSKKYIDMLTKLKEMNFRISGKVLLAAAILLRIKSTRLVGKDIDEFDRLFASHDEAEELLFDDDVYQAIDEEKPYLIPRTPQPRKRKVSIYDLMDALQKALEVRERKVIRNMPRTKIDVPEKKKDIAIIIKEMYLNIKQFFKAGNKVLTFSRLLPSEKKEDKVHTFIPLLHLSHQRRVDLDQKEHFGEIEIMLRAEKDAGKETSGSGQKILANQ